MKKPTKTKIKQKAWSAFSKYIRLKYADKNGMVECYTCGKVIEWKQSQAGHGLGGRKNGILFMEELVRTQCPGCNLWGGGKYSIFTQKLIEEYGPDKYFELVKKSNQVVKYTIEDYQAIEEKYKSKLREEV